MGKSVHDDVLDGALDILKNNANLLCVCSTEPTTRTEATSTYELADIVVSGTDFTHANGDTSGRKTTVAQVSQSSGVDNNGTAQHVALVDGTRLLFVTTCPSQVVTSGNDITVNAWDIEIGDPT